MKNLILDRQQIIDALKKANDLDKKAAYTIWTNGVADNDDLQHMSTADLLKDLIYVLNDNLHKLDFNKGLNINNYK
ncbi:MAG: hypothetical protein Unbinned3907contig1000_30 [Prokaryotic dsDNA virus sp.]|nr:MAG: hypothetical protein Unbinned3907contig1000_30 [Prokaryotic dsDNA virus sp.]|tara:strand:- start:1741 stop:1968 length:228 start_codon:yes stop_codon:yes gene_type:complete